MPGFDEPQHLAPIVDEAERSMREPVRVVIAAPPQHGKTVAIKASIIKRLLQPGRRGRSAYVSYNADKAEDESQLTQFMAEEAGIAWSGNRKLWGMRGGCSIKWTGVGGSLTGYPVDDLMVIDDPIKDRVEAESALQRERTWSWWESVAKTRLHPTASVMVVATRWHQDDLSGRLIKAGWRYINLQAIDDATDEILWPARRSREWYEDIRRTSSAYVWGSMYQGNPKPRGVGGIFGAPRFYRPEDLPMPMAHMPCGYGIDLGHSGKGDRSVCVRMHRWDDPVPGGKPRFYVPPDGVVSRQQKLNEFAKHLDSRQQRAPAPMLLIGSASENATVAETDIGKVPRLRYDVARGSKAARAEPLVNDWERVFFPLPEAFPDLDLGWLYEFLDVFDSFTGDEGKRDDEVDATVAAHRVVARGTRDFRAYT